MVSLFVTGRAKAIISSHYRPIFKRQLQRVMKAIQKEHAHVCITLADDVTLHQLNREYRHKDKPTDVLSFAQKAPLVSGLPALLGDVIISVETAQKQIKTTLEAELLHLAVHGICHLLGYDHETLEEERVMFGYETLLREQALHKRRVVVIPPPPFPTTKN